jgi:hypothetical protein
METRLGVSTAARYPLFRPLMWHTVSHYHALLCRDSAIRHSAAAIAADAAQRPPVSAWELSGLPSVLSFLRRSLNRGSRAGLAACPPSISDPAGLTAVNIWSQT